MTVCITGMHRSGTSMVARLLNLCGLYLGPEERIMPPDAGNPAGYWQSLDMDQLTEDVLAHHSGDWDFLLPPMPPGWEREPAMAPFRQRAQQLILTMSQRERFAGLPVAGTARVATPRPWGWKDPRCSLVLPFWKSVLPGLKVVVCLRNPVETARSLENHTGGTDSFSYNLWLRYYQRILSDTQPDERLITHYDMYFVDPRGELGRILQWLGWSVSEEQIDTACGTISRSHRQQRLAAAELAEAKVPLEVLEAYEALCVEGGDALREALEEGSIPRLKPKRASGYRLPEADTTPEEVKQEAKVAFERAHALIARYQHREALETMQKVVALHPFHARAQNDLGVLYLTDGDKAGALAHLSCALKLDPGNVDTTKNLAELYMELGRTEDAIQTFLDIVDRHPTDVEVLYWLSVACASQGLMEQAGRLFSRVLELEPGHAGAKKGLSLIEEKPPTG